MRRMYYSTHGSCLLVKLVLVDKTNRNFKRRYNGYISKVQFNKIIPNSNFNTHILNNNCYINFDVNNNIIKQLKQWLHKYTILY